MDISFYISGHFVFAIIYPWQIIPILTDENEIPQEINSFLSSGKWNVATILCLDNKNEVENAVKELINNTNMFLFLKNIKNIEFKTDDTYKSSIIRNDDKIEIHQNNILKAKWLLYSKQLTVPLEINEQIALDTNVPDKLKEATSIELSLAAKIENGQLVALRDGEQLLYAYLPTDEKRYYLPILVNSSFLTSANRQSLHENYVWNQWIFKSIAFSLFEWIAELVEGQYQYQAYNLIPNQIPHSDLLSRSFNESVNEALDSVPFIISKQDTLLTRAQAIQDFTFLSNTAFVGGDIIQQFVIQRDNKPNIVPNPFIANTNFGKVFKKIGVSTFDWEDMSRLFQFTNFKQGHNIADNIELIKHFKYLIDRENIKQVSNKISSWEFIYDHKGVLKKPSQIYSPTPDDSNWNSPDSEISFLHPDILNWLRTSSEYNIWLGSLGVTEKTDLSYLKKTILSDPSTFITLENAIPTIQTIYKLYLKNELDKELLCSLGELKLLTKNNNLVTANKCYFSDVYEPRLSMEALITEDIFVNESYLPNRSERDEWKRFFKMIGVKEGIEIIKIEEKTNINSIVSEYALGKLYFNRSFYGDHFKADHFKNIIFFSFLNKTSDYKFSLEFWKDILKNFTTFQIIEDVIAYWGYSEMSGQISGNTIESYMIWYINNLDCIPTTMCVCRKTTDILLNDDNIIELASNYLPIFDGPDLSSDWKSFFQFRSQLELKDYLELLTNIVTDTTEGGKIKQENRDRIQNVYSFLLDLASNWSEEEIVKVQEWAKDIKLPDKSGIPHSIDNLRYYADGDTSIFQDEFNFIFLNSSNRKHPHIETFLNILRVKIFKQEEFKVSYNEEDKFVSSLKFKLETISPYLEKWILSKEQAGVDSKAEDLYKKIEKLKIYEVSELKIKYKDWEKVVQFHLKDDVLYVTSPWDSNMSLMYLPDKLCQYLKIKGFENELGFLLRSEEYEIQQHFKQEQIELPEGAIIIEEKQTVEVGKIVENPKEITSDDFIGLGVETIEDFNALLIKDKTLSSAFFHSSIPSFERLESVQAKLRRAKTNIINYLPTIGYDCSGATEIAPSIFGGIKKDEKDIYIVTRPSDNDVVLLYYTSELDVLEYVDTEFWYEDGTNTPKQITFGQVLKKTGINSIPVSNQIMSNSDIETLFQAPKSETLDFDVVPYAPQKIARIISSFANTNGGTLVFGLTEINSSSDGIVGLSTDFKMIEITKKALSLLSIIPLSVTYEWKKIGENNIFIIKTDKSDIDILLDDKKYVRVGVDSVLEKSKSEEIIILNDPEIKKTVAIIIAIEKYAPVNKISSVKYAKNDAFKFKEMLIDVMNVFEDDIIIFTDEEALKSSLEYNLKGLFNSLTEDDRLIFYYAGHGFHNGVTNYLSTYDTHKYHITETSISLTEILLDPLRKSKCKNALIFIDACAQIFQDKNQRTQISDINDEELLILSCEFPYYATFLSCQPGESSYSSDYLQNGIWTYHLVEALKGNVKEAIKNNKYITDRSLSDYLSDTVAAYTQNELNRNQNPKTILDSTYENVIVKK